MRGKSSTLSNTPASTVQAPILPMPMEAQVLQPQIETRAAQPLPPAYTPYADQSNNSVAQARPRTRLIVNAPTLICGSQDSFNQSSLQQIRSSLLLLHMLASKPETRNLFADRDVVVNCGLTVVGNGNAAVPNTFHPQPQVQGQMHAQPLARTVASPSLNDDSSARTHIYPQSGSSSPLQRSNLVPVNTPACVSPNYGVDVDKANRNDFISEPVAQKRCNGTSHQKVRKGRADICKSSPKDSSIFRRSTRDEFIARNSTARLTRLQKRQLIKTVSIIRYSSFSLKSHDKVF